MKQMEQLVLKQSNADFPFFCFKNNKVVGEISFLFSYLADLIRSVLINATTSLFNKLINLIQTNKKKNFFEFAIVEIMSNVKDNKRKQ
jgi:hypothetical protein